MSGWVVGGGGEGNCGVGRCCRQGKSSGSLAHEAKGEIAAASCRLTHRSMCATLARVHAAAYAAAHATAHAAVHAAAHAAARGDDRLPRAPRHKDGMATLDSQRWVGMGSLAERRTSVTTPKARAHAAAGSIRIDSIWRCCTSHSRSDRSFDAEAISGSVGCEASAADGAAIPPASDADGVMGSVVWPCSRRVMSG